MFSSVFLILSHVLLGVSLVGFCIYSIPFNFTETICYLMHTDSALFHDDIQVDRVE